MPDLSQLSDSSQICMSRILKEIFYMKDIKEELREELNEAAKSWANQVLTGQTKTGERCSLSIILGKSITKDDGVIHIHCMNLFLKHEAASMNFFVEDDDGKYYQLDPVEGIKMILEERNNMINPITGKEFEDPKSNIQVNLTMDLEKKYAI